MPPVARLRRGAERGFALAAGAVGGVFLSQIQKLKRKRDRLDSLVVEVRVVDPPHVAGDGCCCFALAHVA